jgi:hypothetical protein
MTQNTGFLISPSPYPFDLLRIPICHSLPEGEREKIEKAIEGLVCCLCQEFAGGGALVI